MWIELTTEIKSVVLINFDNVKMIGNHNQNSVIEFIDNTRIVVTETIPEIKRKIMINS